MLYDEREIAEMMDAYATIVGAARLARRYARQRDRKQFEGMREAFYIHVKKYHKTVPKKINKMINGDFLISEEEDIFKRIPPIKEGSK